MIDTILEFIENINFFEIQDSFSQAGFYDYLFPYLLIYALLITILPYAKIFQDKKGEARKSITTTLSLIIAFYAVSFEISRGETIGTLLMVLFPNISALTIGILSLYILGAILGVDVFKGLFRKDISAQLYLTIAGIGLGMVIYFLGISFGLWDYDPLDTGSMWNVIIALLLGILAIVFLLGGNFALSILFAVVVLSWIFGPQNESILMSFVDPFVFILVVFVFLLSSINKDGDEKQILAKELEKSRKAVENYQKKNGEPKLFQSRIYDITHQNYLNKLKKWQDKYGEEDYRSYL